PMREQRRCCPSCEPTSSDGSWPTRSASTRNNSSAGPLAAWFGVHGGGGVVRIDCSLWWARRTEDFRDAFSLVPEYLRSPDDVLNLSELAIPLGRRFRALQLWAVLRRYGLRALHKR